MRSWRFVRIIGLIASVALFIIIWWSALVTRNSIDIERVELISENLPQQFNNYKIAQISDLHVGTYGNDTTYLSRLVSTINKLNPDIILFTGDIVNRESSELLPFMSTLSKLSAKDGVYSILGNHDYGDYMKWNSAKDKADNLNLLLNLQSQMGWHMLNNDYTFIYNQGDSIALIGVENWGDPPFTTYGDLSISYPELNDSNFKILMSHNPAHWDAVVLPESNIDLTLSGHTHAMQMQIKIGNHKFSPSVFRYKHWGGLYNEGEQYLYVNIGIGEVGIPARFGATPEITLITLKSKQ